MPGPKNLNRNSFDCKIINQNLRLFLNMLVLCIYHLLNQRVISKDIQNQRLWL